MVTALSDKQRGISCLPLTHELIYTHTVYKIREEIGSFVRFSITQLLLVCPKQMVFITSVHEASSYLTATMSLIKPSCALFVLHTSVFMRLDASSESFDTDYPTLVPHQVLHKPKDKSPPPVPNPPVVDLPFIVAPKNIFERGNAH